MESSLEVSGNMELDGNRTEKFYSQRGPHQNDGLKTPVFRSQQTQRGLVCSRGSREYIVASLPLPTIS